MNDEPRKRGADTNPMRKQEPVDAGQGATPPPVRTKWSDLRRRVYLPDDDLSGPPRYTDEYNHHVPFGATVSGIIETGPAVQDIEILDACEWVLAEANPDG